MGFDYRVLATNGFEMPAGWQVVSVGDVATINELSIQANYPHRTIEYIDIASVEKGAVKSVQVLPLEDAPSRARRIVRDSDTLIATVRPNLEHYVHIKRAKPNTVASTGFAVVTANNVDPRFLYYYLTTKPFTAYLAQIADSHTSAYPAFNPDIIEAAELLLPWPQEQRAIAAILGALDDKIELNRRMNETLEAMARALFKSWFVDFEPFRALGMQDSPLGPIPKGWRTGKLDEIIELQYGKGLKDGNRRPGGIPVYGSNGQVGWHDEALVSGPGIVVGRKGNPGVVTWVPCDFYPIDTTFYVVPIGPIHSMYFLFHVLQRLDLSSLGADSAVPGLNRNLAYMSDSLIPTLDSVGSFDTIAKPWRDKAYANEQESLTLASIRDALLPKLLSGEIRVKDAEKFVERAV